MPVFPLRLQHPLALPDGLGSRAGRGRTQVPYSGHDVVARAGMLAKRAAIEDPAPHDHRHQAVHVVEGRVGGRGRRRQPLLQGAGPFAPPSAAPLGYVQGCARGLFGAARLARLATLHERSPAAGRRRARSALAKRTPPQSDRHGSGLPAARARISGGSAGAGDRRLRALAAVVTGREPIPGQRAAGRSR